MAIKDSAQSKQLNQREHNEDASAKRVVPYYFGDDGQWHQNTPAPVGGLDYDYIAIDDSTPGTEVYEFRLGGSGGTTVKTVTITDDYIEYT